MFDLFSTKSVIVSLAAYALYSGCLLGNSGCATIPDKAFDVMNGAAAQAMAGLKEGQAEWGASFEGINPGYQVEFGVKYFGHAYVDGVAGQFHAGAQGSYSADGVDGIAATIMRDSSLSAEAKLGMIKDLYESTVVSSGGGAVPSASQPAPPLPISGLTDADREWIADEIKDIGAATE